MTDKIVKSGNNYEIVEGSLSVHCCFEYSIMKKGWHDCNRGTMTMCVCECFEIDEAELVFNALEAAASQSTTI